MTFLELPLWVILLLVILLAAVGYLLWRVMKCKCGLYETFEGEAKADAEAEAEDDAEAEVVVKDTEEKVVEPETETEADADTETAPEGKKKPKPKSKSMADKFMDYGEMKIFDSLRENAYSLQDVKRMIREGEITEKMIEKFLARVEAMEDRSASADAEASDTKKKDTVIEGFGGRSYASAAFY
jgi:pyruvate/2-oxoglutarate dehydrogenase complex dihydrolipoamide acyltransferase (E2) component